MGGRRAWSGSRTEETDQTTAEAAEQIGTEVFAPPEEPPQDMGAPDVAPEPEDLSGLPGEAFALPEGASGNAPEVMEVEMAAPAEPPDTGPEDGVFCNLPDGTVCMCSYSYQHEDSDFQAGDSVMLVVQRFEREKRQMYGKILSKW